VACAGRISSGHGALPDRSSESEPLPLIHRWEPMCTVNTVVADLKSLLGSFHLLMLSDRQT